MKASELMIGDWVYVPHNGNATHCGRITAILPSGTVEVDLNGDTVLCGSGSVEPITITQEILEKNGWKDVSDHTLKGCETFRLHLEQRSFDYTLMLKMRDYFRLDSYDDRVYTLCEVNFGFKYVHQLQHALRLCGIDKEIEL